MRARLRSRRRRIGGGGTSDLLDDLKHEVPIWKHQIFSDGREEWVGAC
ncbi:hypothetical protein SIM91_04345 [Rhodococcus opacus]|nr:hypothetical protein [Rhodococcus opacus]MDX5962564.1 hypothetical protein [Rhodococcus opacus]